MRHLLPISISVALLSCRAPSAFTAKRTAAGDTHGSPRLDSPSRVTDAVSRRCIIGTQENIIVFDIEGGEYPSALAGEMVRLTERMTVLLRSEVERGGLSISPARTHPFYRQHESDCRATPLDDGSCMAKVGDRLGAIWVLWGQVSVYYKSYKVDLQLVPTHDSRSNRHLSRILDVNNLESEIRAMWSELISVDP